MLREPLPFDRVFSLTVEQTIFMFVIAMSDYTLLFFHFELRKSTVRIIVEGFGSRFIALT